MCGHTYVAWKTTDKYAFITEQVLLFSSQIYECDKSYHEVCFKYREVARKSRM